MKIHLAAVAFGSQRKLSKLEVPPLANLRNGRAGRIPFHRQQSSDPMMPHLAPTAQRRWLPC
jgi:hypothetical protein